MPFHTEDIMRKHLKDLDITTLDAVLFLAYSQILIISALYENKINIHDYLQNILTKESTLSKEELLTISCMICAPLTLAKINETQKNNPPEETKET